MQMPRQSYPLRSRLQQLEVKELPFMRVGYRDVVGACLVCTAIIASRESESVKYGELRRRWLHYFA